MKKLLSTIWLLLIITVIILTAGIPLTYAQTGDFTIYPSYIHKNNKNWIILDLEQGSKKTDYVTIENLTDKKQSIKIEFKEAKEEEGSYLPIDNEPYKNLGLWIEISENIVTLNPNEKRKIPIEITIPNKANIDEYKGTILASKTEKNEQNLNITTRIGVRTYININKTNLLQTNIFTSSSYKSVFFFILSFIGVVGSILYSIINKKHA
jgi:uncharacterized membrane protein